MVYISLFTDFFDNISLIYLLILYICIFIIIRVHAAYQYLTWYYICKTPKFVGSLKHMMVVCYWLFFWVLTLTSEKKMFWWSL
jgi:hypothetical protein